MGSKKKNYIYFWCYGHYNVKNGSFFAFSADDSKKLVTIWGKYFSESGRPYLALSGNATYGFVISELPLARC